MSDSGGGVPGLGPIVARDLGAPARGWIRAGVLMGCILGLLGCKRARNEASQSTPVVSATTSAAQDASPQVSAGYGEPVGARVEASAMTPAFEVAVASSGEAVGTFVSPLTALVAQSLRDCGGLRAVAESKPALSLAFSVVAGRAQADSIQAPALPEAELGCVSRGLLGQKFPVLPAPQKFLLQFRLTS
ncbi:MAG TPA: hypothetical protein VFQ61_03990 [Polyangiaceae bacterium]|nr:hypothetical protein [Polyangiaceae bacterium]